MEQTISYKLSMFDQAQTFEGPLDLLLHLIEKNRIDIMNIPIAQITDQYFACLDEMKQVDMDIMSDFLVMAATLLEIKARMLLPPDKDEEGEEIDPRSELVERLLEYKVCKAMSSELKEREDEAAFVLYRDESIPEEVKKYREPVDLGELLQDVTLERLEAIFRDVIRRQADRVDTVRSGFGRIEKETVDAKEVMKSVEKCIMQRKRCSFRKLLEHNSGKMYVVVTFLTVLELMRTGKITAKQDELFGEIVITAKDKSRESV